MLCVHERNKMMMMMTVKTAYKSIHLTIDSFIRSKQDRISLSAVNRL